MENKKKTCLLFCLWLCDRARQFGAKWTPRFLISVLFGIIGFLIGFPLNSSDDPRGKYFLSFVLAEVMLVMSVFGFVIKQKQSQSLWEGTKMAALCAFISVIVLLGVPLVMYGIGRLALRIDPRVAYLGSFRKAGDPLPTYSFEEAWHAGVVADIGLGVLCCLFISLALLSGIYVLVYHAIIRQACAKYEQLAEDVESGRV